jgi:hypothetical protein
MGRISVEFEENIPRYACTSCFNCTSIMGESHCNVKNRGCCSYFPKFTLLEIHKMSKTLMGLQTLDIILKNPGTVVYQYYLHVKGYFDKEGHERYLREEYDPRENLPKDTTVFFRACPFVKAGQGCTLPAKYRNHVCNFFICSEVIKEANANSKFQRYMTECTSYSKWVDWENSCLERILAENNVNLVSNFNKSVEILQSIPLSEYEFPALEPIEYDDTCGKGA